MSRAPSPSRNPTAATRERMDRMIGLLEEHGALTENQLAEYLHVTPNVVNQMVWTAHDQCKVHIAGQTYSKLRKNFEVNLWGAGSKPDVLSPAMQKRLHSRVKCIENAGTKKVDRDIKPFRDQLLFITAGRPL
ncbi:hypothetical protein IAG25_35455 [Caballeronia sp. EK]|uniref:hypothetical protein n=1 Tax=Caballeronia sp. EK TaxID=2767469 RepID=UPI001655EFA6|nr:hypothetical protein [Caballeronia sp. EK]MBC8642105.1 hypothetical protein [Caballeronia sp. EK]